MTNFPDLVHEFEDFLIPPQSLFRLLPLGNVPHNAGEVAAFAQPEFAEDLVVGRKLSLDEAVAAAVEAGERLGEPDRAAD